MRQVLIWLIRQYQRTLSPDHGWGRVLYPNAGCRFHPSCSEYARQAIDKQGVLRGVGTTCLRLARCHPWAKGGLDPIA